MSTKRQSLIEKHTKLKEEVSKLQETLKIKKEEFEIRNAMVEHSQKEDKRLTRRITSYDDLHTLPDFKENWENSFFNKHRLVAEIESNITLRSKDIKYITEWQRDYSFNPMTNIIYPKIIVICTAVIATSKGPKLSLCDPYGSIVTEPLTKTSLEEATSWIGRTMIAEIGFQYHSNKHPLKRIRLLKS